MDTKRIRNVDISQIHHLPMIDFIGNDFAIFDDIKDIAQGFHKIKDDDIVRGMTVMFPALKLIAGVPIIHKISQKILIFEKWQ